MIVDLSAQAGQAVVGDVVGVSQQAVSAMMVDGRLPAHGTVGEIVRAYCARLREQAAGRHSDGTLDLAQERAALAREQRHGIEIKNAVLRGQYADVALLSEVLAAACQAVAERFDHLPGQLRQALPDLPAAAIDRVMSTIAAARNGWVRDTAELVAASVLSSDDAGDDEPELEGLDDEPRAD